MDLIYGKTLKGFGLPVWRASFDAAAGESAGTQVMKLLEDKVIQPFTGSDCGHAKTLQWQIYRAPFWLMHLVCCMARKHHLDA